jgi:hypothetical protein
MPSRRVALVKTDVSKKHVSSVISVTKIGELGTTVTVTSNRNALRGNAWRPFVPAIRRFLQASHGVTSQKTASFTATAVKVSNLT